MKLTPRALSAHIHDPHSSEYAIDHKSYSARGSFDNQRVLTEERPKTLACGPLISEVNYLSESVHLVPSLIAGWSVVRGTLPLNINFAGPIQHRSACDLYNNDVNLSVDYRQQQQQLVPECLIA